MTIDPTAPAFPPSIAVDQQDTYSSLEWNNGRGMTIRTYLAAMAPDDIPGWFQIEWDENPPRPPIIDGEHLKSTRIRDACMQWRRSYFCNTQENCSPFQLKSIGEGIEEKNFLAEYERAFTEYSELCEDRRRRHGERRFFAWRVHYANSLIAELNKDTPDE